MSKCMHTYACEHGHARCACLTYVCIIMLGWHAAQHLYGSEEGDAERQCLQHGSGAQLSTELMEPPFTHTNPAAAGLQDGPAVAERLATENVSVSVVGVHERGCMRGVQCTLTLTWDHLKRMLGLWGPVLVATGMGR